MRHYGRVSIYCLFMIRCPCTSRVCILQTKRARSIIPRAIWNFAHRIEIHSLENKKKDTLKIANAVERKKYGIISGKFYFNIFMCYRQKKSCVRILIEAKCIEKNSHWNSLRNVFHCVRDLSKYIELLEFVKWTKSSVHHIRFNVNW